MVKYKQCANADAAGRGQRCPGIKAIRAAFKKKCRPEHSPGCCAPSEISYTVSPRIVVSHGRLPSESSSDSMPNRDRNPDAVPNR